MEHHETALGGDVSEDDNHREAAVTIREAYKRFGSTVILKGLNMTVPEGTM